MNALPGTKSRRRIYLMRHGHVDYLSKDIVASGAINEVPLTPRGRSQAEAAGKAFAHIPFDRAASSGFPRTRETAEIVLSFQNAPPQLETLPDLVEIQGGKSHPVKSRAELIERMNENFANAGKPKATNHDGGEVFEKAQARAVNTIKRLLAEPGWHTMLITAHEGINRLILSWMTGAGLSAMAAFEQDTGCINVLDFDLRDGKIVRPLIKAVNVTPYGYLKHGMNLTSLEAIFERDMQDVLV
ncbi:MAG TPA: histidine phosphatase family protein [Rhizomicrobium sp.]|jgi:probable phosphoglycerate mutase